MKKGIFVLLAIMLGAFILHGCHSNRPSIHKQGRSAYPVGHDMHPDTKPDENNQFNNDGFS